MFALIVAGVLLPACKSKKASSTVSSAAPVTAEVSTRVNILEVNVVNNEIIVHGSNLAIVSMARVGYGQNTSLMTIKSKQDNMMVLTPKAALEFLVGRTYDLILSSAYGATNFPLLFELPDNSVTPAKLQNGAVGATKLGNMGASDGDVLRWNGIHSTWEASPANLSRYQGTWNPNLGSPDSNPLIGDFHIVNVNGVYDGRTWAVGDQAVWDGEAWDQIPSNNNVISVYGRTGVIVAQTNDYTWAQINKTDSSIFDITDVDDIGLADGKVLKWSASANKWQPATDDTGASANVVTMVNGQVGNVVLDTDDLLEGATNKFFSNARTRSALSVTAPLNYNA